MIAQLVLVFVVIENDPSVVTVAVFSTYSYLDSTQIISSCSDSSADLFFLPTILILFLVEITEYSVYS